MKLDEWIKKQTMFSWGSYFFGLCAFIIAIDGLFILPLEATRYGITNIGLETAFQLMLMVMILILLHESKNKS